MNGVERIGLDQAGFQAHCAEQHLERLTLGGIVGFVSHLCQETPRDRASERLLDIRGSHRQNKGYAFKHMTKDQQAEHNDNRDKSQEISPADLEDVTGGVKMHSGSAAGKSSLKKHLQSGKAVLFDDGVAHKDFHNSSISGPPTDSNLVPGKSESSKSSMKSLGISGAAGLLSGAIGSEVYNYMKSGQVSDALSFLEGGEDE